MDSLTPREETAVISNGLLDALRNIRRWMLGLPIPTRGATHQVTLMDSIIAELERVSRQPIETAPCGDSDVASSGPLLQAVARALAKERILFNLKGKEPPDKNFMRMAEDHAWPSYTKEAHAALAAMASLRCAMTPEEASRSWKALAACKLYYEAVEIMFDLPDASDKAVAEDTIGAAHNIARELFREGAREATPVGEANPNPTPQGEE